MAQILQKQMSHNHCFILVLSLILLQACGQSFATKMDPEQEFDIIHNKKFVSNTDEEHTIVLKTEKNVSVTYKTIDNEKTNLVQQDFEYSLENIDDVDIESWNNLMWHIDDFNVVRIYRININFAFFGKLEAHENLCDSSFSAFVFPSGQLYLFHFKSIEDLPRNIQGVASSNVYITRSVWGNTVSDNDGNLYVPPSPSVFSLNY